MSFYPAGYLLLLLVYIVLAAVIVLLGYLAVRFGVRDGLRGHRLWLERTGRTAARTTDED